MIELVINETDPIILKNVPQISQINAEMGGLMLCGNLRNLREKIIKTMVLINYHSNQFEILNSWVPNADALLLFAGTDFNFPLTKEQLDQHISHFPDREYYFGTENDEPVAFGEIIPQETGIPRLGRLIVKPEKRGLGFGKKFITALTNRCVARFNCPAVELYVIDTNQQAINCYLKLGFQFLEGQDLTPIFNGKKVLAKKMRLLL